MFCTRRPARDLFYPQHFKRLNSSRRDPRPGTRAARRGETGPSACRLLLLPASEFWPKLKSVWQWPSFPINQVHHRRRLLAQRGSEERSGVQLSEYAAAASLQSAVLQVVEVLVTLHDAEDRVTVYRVWALVLVVTRRWMQCSGVWWLVLH